MSELLTLPPPFWTHFKSELPLSLCPIVHGPDISRKKYNEPFPKVQRYKEKFTLKRFSIQQQQQKF